MNNISPALLVPAAAASLAYLNAKTAFFYDWNQLTALLSAIVQRNIRLRHDKLNVFYGLEEHALSTKTSNNIFLVFQGREWTYKEAYETVLKYGQWLKTFYGVKKGDIVAMDFMNSDKFIFIFMGLWSIGANPAFINYNLTGKPLLHCLKLSRANLLLVDEEIKSVISEDVMVELTSDRVRQGSGRPMQIVYVDSKEEQKIMNLSPIREPNECRNGAKLPDMAALIYTSGTTGLPKAAVISWDKCFKAGGFVANWLGIKTTDRYYTAMPLYHATAFLLAFNTTVYRGNTLVIGHKFFNRTFWQEVRATDSTIIQYVGETCRYLLTAPPQIDPTTGENLDRKNKVRMAMGNGLRPDIWNRFKERFGIDAIVEFYGSTEGHSMMGNISRNEFTRGAIGRNGLLARLVYGRNLTLVAVDWETEMPWRDPKTGFCKAVRHGDPGELLYTLEPKDIKAKFQGYFGNQSATESKILRDVFKKGDAYMRTGDVVRLDREGRWYFSDRIGDTYRWKSENVSTSEVAEALGTHPAIAEANVYGVSLPHHEGRAGCACIVLNPSAGSLSSDLLQSLASHAQSHLSKYAVPLFIRVTTNMTTTGTNKQQKHTLRAEGVDPKVVGKSGDKVYWLRPGSGAYEPFGEKEWEVISQGKAKL